VTAAVRPAAADADRAAYVEELVRAVTVTGDAARERDAVVAAVRLGARTSCRSAYGKPTVRCLLAVARDVCKGKPATCLRVADVAVTNLLAEDEWVDTSTRVQIMNASDDYRAAMDRELEKRYAPLAAEMSLAPGFATGDQLGASIDRFCVAYTSKRRLAWQRCVAAMVWYAGTIERSRP
jgi:hypothetical protein